jgi:hypothetical protein
MKTKLQAGMKITLLNKFGDEIAEDIISEVNTRSVILENGDEFLLKHITSEKLDAATVQIGVTGASL